MLKTTQLFASRLAAVLVVALLHANAIAQEAVYLALQGDGTASVIVDDVGRTAYVADGGRRGGPGIAGATIDGLGVLAYLKKRNVSRLVISCSHPHQDHMGGLSELVCADAIHGFDVRFVDNGVFPPGVTPLHKQYQECWNIPDADMKARYFSASNKDAFRQMTLGSSSSLRASTFKYDPASLGKDTHDASVIMQYDIGNAHQSSRVVDFDDSSQKLINRWVRPTADAPPPRVDVLIHPHHGSRNNRIDEILERREEFGLRDVVITVNERNRFLHPSPEVLLKLFETMGPDHVHVTGSTRGDNVVIGDKGVVPREDTEAHRGRLIRLINTRIQQTESRIKARVERLPAGSSADTDPKVQRYLTDIAALLAARSIAGGPPDERSEMLSSSGRGFEPPDAADVAPNSEGPLPGPSGGGSGAYIDKVKRQGRAASTSSGDTEGGGGSRVAAFEKELGGFPNWGGVIVGNATGGDELRSIEFFSLPEEEFDFGEEPVVAIRVTTADGRVGDYVSVTPSELWSAHRFVQPTADLAVSAENAQALENAIGLVGITNNRDNVWDFAIAPAIADTPLAEDAMRLDMAIAAASAPDEFVPKSDLVRAVQWPTMFKSYQWYDARSKVTVEGGVLRVLAEDEPATCLMRVRLVSRPDGFEKRAGELQQKAQQEYTQQAPALSIRDRMILHAELQRELDEQVRQLAVSVPGLGASIGELCRGFDALHSVDRFAKIVAVLNRYRDSTGKPLPELPAWVTPLKRSVPAEWPMERVFQAATMPTDEPEPAPTPLPTPEPEPSKAPWWRTNWPWMAGGLLVLGLGGVLLRRRMA